MNKAHNTKKYDPESRKFMFAQNMRLFIKKLPKTLISLEDLKQLVRSSGSIGAKYIEANESLSKKDLYMRLKICRKEAKDTIYWLKLLTIENKKLDKLRISFIDEATQLMKILGSIITSSNI